MLCCGGDGNHADDFEPIPYRDEKQQVEELRGRLSAIMQPLEVGFDQQATVNLSMTRPRPNTPAGAFERRQSVSFRAAPAAGQRAGPAGGPALQWTDSRKLLEAAIAMEQIEAGPGPDVPAAIPEYAPPAGAGWGWAAERDALAAEEARLQRRLWKLKLEHFVMEGDGNCQFRAVSFGLYGTPRHHGYVRRKAVEYMRAARGDFEAFLGEDFASYLRQMARAGTWGDELTLRAVSEALATVVNVISSDAAHWFMRYIPRTTRPQHEIFVTYIAPLHYNAIRRQNTGTRLRASFGRQGSQLARAVSTYQRRYGIPETPQHVVAAATGG